MNKPEFGAMFFDKAVEQGAKMFWGARGAIRDRKLEIYWDRQSFVADDQADKPEFVRWINDTVIPYLELNVKKRNTKHLKTERYFNGGNFHAVADELNSGGYLYIGAWEVADEQS